ncbi:MAG: glycine--tRNA ligase subunit beta [Acidobacteriota bacterium]
MSGTGRDFLLEVGCEEIPHRMLDPARRDLAEAVRAALVASRLLPDDDEDGRRRVVSFATPRRLAVRMAELPPRQPDASHEITGPPVAAAYDASGAPTRAARGFAAGQGVDVDQLYRVAGPRGEVVAVRRTERGLPTPEVLGTVIPKAVLGLSFPKAMSWGAGEYQFVRPIRWVVALLGRQVVDLSVAGVRAGRTTLPRRGSGHAAVELPDAAAYEAALLEVDVMVDPGRRREAVLAGIEHAAAEVGGQVVEDAPLADTCCNLVEYPLCLAGMFSREFLDLPREVLTTTLCHHQHSFSVKDGQGSLVPCFVAVVNARSDAGGAIRWGYERVIAGRLADARFFYKEDRRQPLETRREILGRTRFHRDLGSYAGKVARLETLSRRLCELAGLGDAAAGRAARAARLSKCDLATQMENEFPELQGIVGGIYAREEGEPGEVWRAIYDHYRPGGLRDPLPRDPEGAVLSVADRLDTLVGLMGVGVTPKGSRDPFALRRAALGLVRILVERPLHLSLEKALHAAREGYGGAEIAWKEDVPSLVRKVAGFIQARLRYLLEHAAQGHRYDSIAAVLAAGWDDPAAASQRLSALSRLRGEDDFEALAAASKRIRKILEQAASRGQDVEGLSVDRSLLREAAERELEKAARAAADQVEEALAAGEHETALRSIAALRPYVDRFFDTVLVMAEEPATRRNRLALLASLAALYTREADFSEIVVEGMA